MRQLSRFGALAFAGALFFSNVQAQQRLFVANSGDNTVSVVSPALNQVVATYPSLPSPSYVAASNKSSRVYVRTSSGIAEIDARTGAVLGTTLGFPGNEGIVLSPQLDRLYIVKTNTTAFDPSELCAVRPIDRLSFGCVAAPGTEPQSVAVSPDSARIYVSNHNTSLGFGGTLSVFDASPFQYVGEAVVGTEPRGVVVHPANNRVYVANTGSGSVSVVDAVAKSTIATITVGLGPRQLALSANGDRLYVANSLSDTISVIDTVSNAVVRTLQGVAVPTGLVLARDGVSLYVSSGSDNRVYTIDIRTDTILGSVVVGALPELSPQAAGGGQLLDIDGDGEVRATTDMLLLLRWQLGVRGSGLASNVVFTAAATRSTVGAIEAYLLELDNLLNLR